MKAAIFILVLLVVYAWCSSSDTSPCTETPAVTGPCRASQPRWTYNPERDMCQRFFYGGCNGTRNNFPTQEDCESTCCNQ